MSVLDPVQKQRCRDVFDDNETMLDNVKNQIINHFEKWYEQLDDKSFDVVEYKMTGSSTGFQYTDSSDIDIQVVVKVNEGHNFSEILRLIKILPNGNNLEGTSHPVNYYFVNEENPTKMDFMENLYNISTNTWEKKSEKEDVHIPVNYIREISRFFTDGFDLAIGRFTRDKQYLLDALKLNPEQQEISEKEKQDEIDKQFTQLQADIDSLRLCIQLLTGLNATAYSDDEPFKISINYTSDDPHFKVENLIYKAMDKFEYKQKMRDLVKEGQDFIKEQKKQQNLTESLSELFEEVEIENEKERISKVLDNLKDIQYGFISKIDGSRIVDRDWIHNCNDLGKYYDVNDDPEVTLQNKLGICTDQSLLTKYLLNKYYPDIKPELYALTKGRYGHCVCGFEDNGKYWHLENAWDKELGLHGPFDSEEDLRKYFEGLYHKHHDKDNDDDVNVITYDEYLKQNLNEGFKEIFRSFSGVSYRWIDPNTCDLTYLNMLQKRLFDFLSNTARNIKKYNKDLSDKLIKIVNDSKDLIKTSNEKQRRKIIKRLKNLAFKIYDTDVLDADILKNILKTFNTNLLKENDNSIDNVNSGKSLKESRLPSDPNKDPEFGVPEQKKYPLFDKAHVKSAIKLFGHVDAEYEHSLARNIIAKMKKYNIPYDSVGEDNKLYKYIPKSFLK